MSQPEWHCYRQTTLLAYVCSSLRPDEAIERTRRELGQCWTFQPRKPKQGARRRPNPTRCSQAPRTHRHFVFDLRKDKTDVDS